MIGAATSGCAYRGPCAYTPDPATLSADSPLCVVDTRTKEQVTVKVADWQKMEIDTNTSYRIDPQTNHLLAPITTCKVCRAHIPVAPVRVGGDAGQAKKTTRCPVCRNNPYGLK